MGEVKNTTNEFIEDPRFKQCNKEAFIGLCLGLLNLIWWFAWGYGLGSKPPEDYSYFLGFPMWFFMSCVVGAVLFSFLAIITVNKYFKDMPLGAINEEEIRKLKEEL